MEFRSSVNFIILAIKNDEITKRVFLKVLTENSLEFVKLAGSLEKSKFSHILKYNYVLTGDLVKTRKNWILKEILNFNSFIDYKSYFEIELYNEILLIINKYLREGQEIEGLLHWITCFFKNKVIDKNIVTSFEKELLSQLGFGQNDISISKIKDSNHIYS
jgi:hypothetical protein